MKKFIPIIMLIVLFLGGCKTAAKIPLLKNSLPMCEVLKLWGSPNQKIQVGSTRKDYPVELWQYGFKKGNSVSGKKENWVLIFVDSELYLCIGDDPDRIFKELLSLGVYDEQQVEFLENQKSSQDAATKAEENRRTMEIIRTYQFYQNTQMQIQTQQLMQTIRRQQMYIPPPVPPTPPAKPIRQ